MHAPRGWLALDRPRAERLVRAPGADDYLVNAAAGALLMTKQWARRISIDAAVGIGFM
jgi:hypothetical protein